MATSVSQESVRDELGDFLQDGRFEEALDVLSGTEGRRELTPAELVSKGRAILLASENTRFPLVAAKEAFERALALDPQNLPALLELAWYYHAVADDSRAAMPLFKQAIELSRRQLTEAARGQAGCLAEMASPAAAAASLRSVHEAALLIESLTEEERGWLEAENEI
jgi:tetratricopeptide (TPR) repeat protein